MLLATTRLRSRFENERIVPGHESTGRGADQMEPIDLEVIHQRVEVHRHRYPVAARRVDHRASVAAPVVGDDAMAARDEHRPLILPDPAAAVAAWTKTTVEPLPPLSVNQRCTGEIGRPSRAPATSARAELRRTDEVNPITKYRPECSSRVECADAP